MSKLTGETTLRIIQNTPIEKEQNDLNSFWKVLKKSDLSDKTIIAYQHDLKLFLKWLFDINPSRTMSSLSEIDIGLNPIKVRKSPRRSQKIHERAFIT